MPVPKGVRIGGRQKGTVNKRTKLLRGDAKEPVYQTAAQRLTEILEGNLPCQTCRGTLKTPYGLAEGSHAADCSFHKKFPIECSKAIVGDPKHRCKKCCTCDGIGKRTCESCYKGGFEICSPELIAKVALGFRREAVPELKSIEHHGNDAKPPIGIRVISVRANGNADPAAMG